MGTTGMEKMERERSREGGCAGVGVGAGVGAGTEVMRHVMRALRGKPLQPLVICDPINRELGQRQKPARAQGGHMDMPMGMELRHAAATRANASQGKCRATGTNKGTSGSNGDTERERGSAGRRSKGRRSGTHKS
jgi:hypothetical protein